MAVDTTPIQTIYNILNQAVSYHPASTEIFDDFLQEAGDIVTLFSGDASFDFPIFSQHMTWMGSMVTSMESTGNKTRNELPPLQRKQKNSSYGSNHRLTETEVQYDTHFIQTDRTIGMEAKAIGVKLDANGNPMIDPNDPNSFVWDDTSSTGAEIFSKLILSPNRAQLVSAINDGTGNQIAGSKVDLSAQGTVLIQAINNRDPSQTSVVIEASKIDLRGYVTTTSFEAVSGFVISLTSQQGYIGTIYSTNVSATSTASAPTGDFTNVYARNYYVVDAQGDTDYKLGVAVSSFGTTSESNGQIIIPYYTNAHPPSTGTPAGNITFNIAATQYYIDHVGITTVSAGGWTYASNSYRNVVTATAKDGTTGTATVTLPTITCDASLGTSSRVTVQAYGPTVLGDSYSLTGSGKTFYLKSDSSYVYLTNSNSTPVTSGTGANVVARATNSGSSSGGISTMSLSNGYSSEPTADYSGSVSSNLWYVVTATPNSGTAKKLKFHVPSTSYNYTPQDIRCGNVSYYASLPSSNNTTFDTLATSIHANKGKSGYVRFSVDLDGYTGTPKYYYIPMSGI